MIKHKELRKIRLARNWTQGKAAQEIGIQQSYLSKLENDQAIASEDILIQICKVYHCNMGDITLLETTRGAQRHKSYLLIYCSIALLLVGAVLFSLSYFGILQNNTAYTYQLSELTDSIITPVNFIVTDEYKGEKFTVLLGTSQVTYELIGQRPITPVMNRILNFAGILSIFGGLALQAVRLVNRNRA